MQWKPCSFLLEICFTKSWHIGLLFIVEQMWSVSGVQHDFGLWMLTLAMFWLLEKIGVGCAPSSMPWLSGLYTEGKPSCSNTSPGLWEAVPREGTLQFRQNQRRFWWLSDVERKPQNVLLFFFGLSSLTHLLCSSGIFFSSLPPS